MSDVGADAIRILVDADGCPVKDEACRVGARYGIPTTLVANQWMRIPNAAGAELVIVEEGLDRADDWIAEAARPGAIVVTSDIPLAARCVKAGARVLSPSGKAHTSSSIGATLATRNLMTELRDTGTIRGGGRPFSKQDRSRFLQQLDQAAQQVRRLGR